MKLTTILYLALLTAALIVFSTAVGQRTAKAEGVNYNYELTTIKVGVKDQEIVVEGFFDHGDKTEARILACGSRISVTFDTTVALASEYTPDKAALDAAVNKAIQEACK